jgi:hypothetical protein
VSGTQLDLEKVSAGDFSAVVDCSHIFQAGEVTLSAQVTLPPRVYLETAVNQEITLDITAKETTED